MLKRVLIALFLLAPASPAADRFQKPEPVRLTNDGNKWAEKTLRKMSLEQKIGQLLMIRAIVEFRNVESPEYRQMIDQLRRYHLGSFLLTVPSEAGFVFRNQPYEAAMLANALQRESELPLLFAADFERGLQMRFQGATGFPFPMAFAAANNPAYTAQFARVVGREARAIGVQWNFFPIADVNSNPVNPIINVRSFGEDPQQVGELVAAYIRGGVEAGMLTTAKHFPGHGDTATDSHLGFAAVAGSRARLDAVELPPFRDAIAAGVDAVMLAHVTVPALDPDPARVASTSPLIVTELLKKQLGFQGLVVPDALDMAALTRLYPIPGRPSVEALKAGNDMVLIPVDLDTAYNALLAAVRSGEVPEAQVDQSVLKVLRAKAAVGLHKARLVDINALAIAVGAPEALALGQDVARAAVTLVRDNGQVLPLKKSGTALPRLAYGAVEAAPDPLLAVLLLEDMRSEAGRVFERELKARVPGARVLYLDPRNAAAMSATVVEAAARAQAIVVAAYVAPSGGKFVLVNGKLTNTVALQDAPSALLQQLLQKAAARTVVVAMGNPYLAAGYPEAQNYLCTFSNVPVSEVAAVQALFGETAITGRLPVTIPGIAPRGAGLDRPSVLGKAAKRRTGAFHVGRRTDPLVH